MNDYMSKNFYGGGGGGSWDCVTLLSPHAKRGPG